MHTGGRETYGALRPNLGIGGSRTVPDREESGMLTYPNAKTNPVQSGSKFVCQTNLARQQQCRAPVKAHAAVCVGCQTPAFLFLTLTSEQSPLNPESSASTMSSTTKLFLSPAPGTVIKPTYEYDDEQKEKLQTLREVCSL